MSDAPIAPASPAKPRWNLTLAVIVGKYRWDPTLIEMLVLTVIAVILGLLLIPEVQYAADGERELPVRVFVFNVDTGEPVPDAEVAVITRGPRGVYSVEDTQEAAKQFVPLQDHLDFVPATQKGRTNEQGMVSLQAVFRSGSSHKHPNTRVFPAKCWVVVSGHGFRGVVISMGREAVEVGEVKRGGGFLVPIGIMRDPAPPK